MHCANVFGGVVFLEDPQDGPLILTPLVENGQTEKAKKLSAVDPSLFAGVESHAAYFTVNKTGKWNLFFWYFPVQGVSVETAPLVIWLQGGPGGSSLYGLFEEIGPIQIVNDTVQKMPITWGSDYSLLFIDNPVGAGFSYSEGGEYATDQDMVGACLLSFIQQFLQVFPELRKAPLFITGESYAGKYIPAFGYYIHNNQNESMPINLKGLSIGDGWIDPPTMLHYSEWGVQIGLLDDQKASEVHKLEDEARAAWDKQDFKTFESKSKKAYDTLKISAPVSNYNYLLDALDDDVEDYPLVSFLNKPEVQSALHVKKMKYNVINYHVYGAMSADIYRTIKPWLEELLEHYGVMCYNGQLDVIVAYGLSVHTYTSFKWSGANDYLNAERHLLYGIDDTSRVTAFVKASGNFMDVMVRGAGHMVPHDKPRAAKQILDLFIKQFK